MSALSMKLFGVGVVPVFSKIPEVCGMPFILKTGSDS
jgi:hypothetical protein